MPVVTYRMLAECEQMPSRPQGNAVFAVSEEGVETAALAELSIGAVPVGANLTLTVVRGVDGALVHGSYRLSSAGRECAMLPDGDGTLRCLPGPAVRILGFGDAACTQPVVDATGLPSDTTMVRAIEPSASCPRRSRVYAVLGSGEVGIPQPPRAQPVYTLTSDGNCVAGDRHNDAVELFGEVEPSSLPAAFALGERVVE